MSEKEPRTEAESSPPDISHRRRTLIKSAAVAAPVVLTLRSGAAAALVSNDQCIARDQQIAQNANPPIKPRLRNTAGDTWVRTSTRCRKLKNPNPNKNNFFVYQDPTGSDLTKWIKLNNENRIYRDSGPGQMKADPGQGDAGTIYDRLDPPGEHDCLILVLFDSNGTVISYGRYTSNNVSGLPITNSCWASIDPMWANP